MSVVTTVGKIERVITASGVSVVTTVGKIERVITASGVSVVTTVGKIERVITASGVSVVTTVGKIERVITASGVSVVTTVGKIERVITASGVSVVTTVEKIERVITASGVSVVTTVEKIERVITASGVSVVTTFEKIGRVITATYCLKLQPLNKNVPGTFANNILPNYVNRNINQWSGIHDNVKYVRLEYYFLNNSDIAWCDPIIQIININVYFIRYEYVSHILYKSVSDLSISRTKLTQDWPSWYIPCILRNLAGQVKIDPIRLIR